MSVPPRAGTPPAERVDNPLPFRPRFGRKAPWHGDGDVHTWEPEFQALVAALDRNQAAGEWGLAFKHLRAAARRNLAFCRAEQYNDFLAVLDELGGDGLTKQEHDLHVDVFREKLATTDADHVARIMDVTLRRLPIADKQRHADPTRRDELADPPTRSEVLAALRLMRGVWIYAPKSCASAGASGAVEALLRVLAGGVPLPPRDSPSDLIARSLEQWQRDGGWKKEVNSGEGRQGEGSVGGGGEDRGTRSKMSPKGPPVMIAFPEGRPDDGEAPRVMSMGWKVDDPVKEFGQPSEDEVRCEALEALLTLLAEDQDCQRDFMRRGGVKTVAGFLVPWLAEGGGEENPSEVVQRCIVFLGVLVQHVLPARGEESGRGLAAEAEATLEEIIGEDATKEILIAAEELDDNPPPNPLDDDSSSEAGSFGSYASRTEREIGEELVVNSLEAMRVSGVDTSGFDDVLTQMAQQQGQEPEQQE